MILFKCDTCELLTSELFKRCPSCGVDGPKTKESYVKIVDLGKLPSKPIKEIIELD